MSKSSKNKNGKTCLKEFSIEKILKSKKGKNETLYLVKWEGYPMKDCTWEPRSHFTNAEAALSEFERRKQPEASIPVKTSTTSLSTRETRGSAQRSKLQSSLECAKRTSKTLEKPIVKKVKVIEGAQGAKLKGVLGQDEAESISNYYLGSDNRLEFEIKWKKNKKGERPQPTRVSSKEFKHFHPRILCDFYETKLKFESS